MPCEYFLLIRRQRRPCLLAIDDGLSLAGQHAGRGVDCSYEEWRVWKVMLTSLKLLRWYRVTSIRIAEMPSSSTGWRVRAYKMAMYPYTSAVRTAGCMVIVTTELMVIPRAAWRPKIHGYNYLHHKKRPADWRAGAAISTMHTRFLLIHIQRIHSRHCRQFVFALTDRTA